MFSFLEYYRKLYFNDVFQYDSSTMVWLKLSDQVKNVPPGRRAHGQALMNGRLYVFGGWAGGN